MKISDLMKIIIKSLVYYVAGVLIYGLKQILLCTGSCFDSLIGCVVVYSLTERISRPERR